VPRTPRSPESRAWGSAIERALDRDAPRGRRLEAATVATQIAAEMRPVDHRLGVSLLTYGRLVLRTDPQAAAKSFAQAYDLFRRQFGADDVRTAQAAVHLAALALGTGQYEIAIALADRSLPAAQEGQNAILIAGLLSFKAEALVGLERPEEAQETRIDSLRWARYGFGDADGALAREQAPLAALMRLENGCPDDADPDRLRARRAVRLAPRRRARRRPARPAAVRRGARHRLRAGSPRRLDPGRAPRAGLMHPGRGGVAVGLTRDEP
jgi:hypothetical protein